MLGWVIRAITQPSIRAFFQVCGYRYLKTETDKKPKNYQIPKNSYKLILFNNRSSSPAAPILTDAFIETWIVSQRQPSDGTGQRHNESQFEIPANLKCLLFQRDNLIEEVTTPVPRLLEEVNAAEEETATSVSAPSSPGTTTKKMASVKVDSRFEVSYVMGYGLIGLKTTD